MIRALFIVLAVVVAVLAWVMSMPWMYLLAGVLALAALGLLVTGWRRARRKAEQPYTGRSYSRENELSDLGIMEIREKKPGDSPSADELERDENDSWKAPPPRGSAPRPKEGRTRTRSGRGKDCSDTRANAASSERKAEGKQSPASSQRSSVAESSTEDQESSGQASSPKSREQDRGREQATRTSRGAEAARATKKQRRGERAEKKRSAKERSGATSSAEASSPGVYSSEETDLQSVLLPTLQALRAALGAQTTALLVQQEMALEYRIEALVSGHERARAEGSFSTDAPLLSARTESQPAATATVGEGGVPRAHLGYYRAPMPAIGHVAFAPVQRRREPSTYFLVADAAADGFADPEPEALMKHFADLLSLLLNRHDRLTRADQTANVGEKSALHGGSEEQEGGEEREADEKETFEAVKQSPAAAASGDGQVGAAASHEARPNSNADDRGARDDRSTRSERGHGEKARPRREIIAEAMAHAGDDPVTLALVYLNRAEHIAGKGAAHVAEAEDALHKRLEEAAPECRIEPFGELTYGLFYTGPTAGVEAWAAEVERTMAAAGPPLEGGVSMGIAVPQDSGADPEVLRVQATEALREAYTTGVCTILE